MRPGKAGSTDRSEAATPAHLDRCGTEPRSGRAAKRSVTPSGRSSLLLLLTGARKSELAEARWSEFDLAKKIWTVPPERFKSNASHLIPLSEASCRRHLKSIAPHFTSDHLFTPTFEGMPCRRFQHRPRHASTQLMGAHACVGYPRYSQNGSHSACFATNFLIMVAEMVIGHGRKGIQRVYDQHL